MDLRIREWEKLTYSDPEPVLRGLRQLEHDPRVTSMPPAVRRLRTGRLKEIREARLATIFCWGMAHVVGTKVLVAPIESQDYDFVAAWRVDDTLHYSPVQLKELPPADLNPSVTVADLFGGLVKYAHSDTVLAVYLNRRDRLSLDDLPTEGTPFSEVWYIWCASEDQSRWGIWGKPLATLGAIEFPYPV